MFWASVIVFPTVIVYVLLYVPRLKRKIEGFDKAQLVEYIRRTHRISQVSTLDSLLEQFKKDSLKATKSIRLYLVITIVTIPLVPIIFLLVGVINYFGTYLRPYVLMCLLFYVIGAELLINKLRGNLISSRIGTLELR